jgi:hypothetical protein
MADAVARFPLMVAGISERGVRAVTSAAPDWPFWLPRAGHVTWSPAPKVGETSVATNPHWLAQKHKQLWQLREVASVASESSEHANTRKENAMANGKDMAGALFKNTQARKR